MANFKEVWAKQARLLEKVMDSITAEYGEILSIEGYIDHLLDFYERDFIEEFYAVIVEYQDELIWNLEQEQERHNKRFLKAMEQGGLFFLDKAAHNGK